jgi:hypothetical protein
MSLILNATMQTLKFFLFYAKDNKKVLSLQRFV